MEWTVRDIEDFVWRRWVVRRKELMQLDAPRHLISWAIRMRSFRQVGRGTFVTKSVDHPYDQRIFALMALAPRGVFTLSTALWIHGVVAEPPKEAWIAIGLKARKPAAAVPKRRTRDFWLSQALEITWVQLAHPTLWYSTRFATTHQADNGGERVPGDGLGPLALPPPAATSTSSGPSSLRSSYELSDTAR